MAYSNIRYEKLLSVLKKNNHNVTKSAIEAGFSKNTAGKQQKRLLQSALKYQMKKQLETLENKQLQSEELVKMAELVGFSREDLMSNLRWLATQEKDLGTRLKVVAPLVKEFGVNLSMEEEQKSVVPVLNVTVKERNDGSTQPFIELPIKE